ncbi:MAG: threonylcarbamoyl-AMP synthase [Saccharofermentans sp.]|nr:threonylcarbamoyl-AMP synthase [Saccharofermentans sp.]
MERKALYETILVKKGDDAGLQDAANHLAQGEVVAFPTETVYGLGADALNPDAVKKIFEAKGRPGDNPLIVHIWNKSQVDELALEVTPLAQKLMDAFMPGPVTIIMKKKNIVPSEVTAGLDTVGIRMPKDPTAAKFLEMCGKPVAAPSANLSGSPSPTTARHVMDDMDGYIYAVVDGGSSEVGLESTVIDATGAKPVILRPGAITPGMVDKLLGSEDTNMDLKLESNETPKAPGMKYRHYAPSAEVKIVSLPSVECDELIPEGKELKELDDEAKNRLFSVVSPFILTAKEILEKNPTVRIGVFAGNEVKTVIESMGDDVLWSHINFYSYGETLDVKGASHCLFDGMRHLDLQGVNVILASGFADEGLGKAYMNRLEKAAYKSGDTPDAVSSEGESYAGHMRGHMSIDDFDSICTSSVLFVCDDNINLSSCCEMLFSNMVRKAEPFCLESDKGVGVEIYAESAGVYAAEGDHADEEMIDAVKEIYGVGMKHHVTSHVSVEKYNNNDLILTMTDAQAFEIIEAYPDLYGRVHSLSSYAASKGLVFKDDKGHVISISIPDPSGDDYDTYVHTVKALGSWIQILFPYILKDLGAELK